jgi:cytidine deaminase
MNSVSAENLEQLQNAARSVSSQSYSPYSRFRVGAALLTSSGKIFVGTNVENASYGLCVCAERNAVFAAVAAGERKFACIALYTPTPQPTMPCGACRQVLNEFNPSIPVVSFCDSAERRETTLAELLPDSFGPQNLAR